VGAIRRQSPANAAVAAVADAPFACTCRQRILPPQWRGLAGLRPLAAPAEWFIPVLDSVGRSDSCGRDSVLS